MDAYLRADEPVADGVRRLAHELTRDAIAHLEAIEDDPNEAIHEARKRCKEVRGLIRLVRDDLPGYRQINVGYRDTARLISEVRDTAATIGTLDGLHEAFGDVLGGEAVARVRQRLVQRNEQAVAEAVPDRSDPATRRLRELDAGIDAWDLAAVDTASIRQGIARSYARGRDRLADVETAPSTEALHELRKRVKYARYHTRLLEHAWPEVLGDLRDAWKELADLLGDDHDLAVLRAVMVDDDAIEERDATLVVAALDRQRAALQHRALHLARRLYAEEPASYADRLGRILEAWRQEVAAANPATAPAMTLDAARD